MNENPIVKIEGLTKTLGRKNVVDDITVDIYGGEVFGFLGPNGAGKTTTIRMMLGLMKASKGDVQINGFSVKKQFVQAMEHVGGIVENPEMYGYMSGYQNLVHYSRMNGITTKGRIDQVLEVVGMKEHSGQKVRRYSLGMRQRLGLAQALLHKPKLLILDEPTNGLDPAGIREMRRHLRYLAEEEGMAVFVSSHLLSEMELMCDRIGIIQKGKLIDVQNVHDFVGGVEEKTLHLTVDPIREAQKILKVHFPKQTMITKGKTIQLQTAPDKVPELITELAGAGINIYEASLNGGTLEDKFLKVTGGEGVV